MTSSRLKLGLYIGGMVLVGATSAWLASRHAKAPAMAATQPSAAAGGKPAPLYYYDPMFPDKRFDKPGKSPFMDMQLVPKYPQAESPGTPASEGSIAIDPRVVQTLGVRLVRAETGAFARGVDASGVVAVDEHGIEAVQVRAAGWVEQLQARAAGDPVRRGQLLAAVYSPDLLATQQEFLIALRSGNAELIAAARERLRLFGLSDGQIARVQATRRAELFRAVRWLRDGARRAAGGGSATWHDAVPAGRTGNSLDHRRTPRSAIGMDPARRCRAGAGLGIAGADLRRPRGLSLSGADVGDPHAQAAHRRRQ